MKKLALLIFAGLTLSACGSAPGQFSGSKVSAGVSAADGASVETATKTVTAATATTPAKTTWTLTKGSGVTFTFMTRPGSDAVYISGYRITGQTISTASGTKTSTSGGNVQKMDLYLTSGYSCAARTSLYSCPFGGSDTIAASGAPATYNIYLEGGLGDLVQSTNASVGQSTDLEFFGTSSNGQAVTIKITGVVSTGSKQGDQ